MTNLDKRERLSHSEKVVMREVYRILAQKNNARLQARELNRKLMKDYGWARNANYVYIKRLQDKGYLIREEGRGYWLRAAMTLEEMMTQCFDYWLTDFDALNVSSFCSIVFDLMGATAEDMKEVRQLTETYVPKPKE